MKNLVENLIVFIATLVVIFLLATVILPRFHYSLIVIKSGSMEPAIKTGSALVVKAQDKYQRGDIITFVNTDNEIVTHRITAVLDNQKGWVRYETKGDANNATDMFLADQKQVVGKVILTLPYVGYGIGFLKSKPGIIILIILPTLYFIVREGWKIKTELKKMKDKPGKEGVS